MNLARRGTKWNLDDVLVGSALLRVAVLGVLEQDSVHVGAGVLEQLVGTVEHDQCDLAVTQNTQLIRLLHQTELALRERHLHNQQHQGSKNPGFFKKAQPSGFYWVLGFYWVFWTSRKK